MMEPVMNRVAKAHVFRWFKGKLSIENDFERFFLPIFESALCDGIEHVLGCLRSFEIPFTRHQLFNSCEI